MRRILVLFLTASFMSLALAACGGGKSDEDQAKEAAEQITAAKSAAEIKEVCSNLLTERFLDQVYGGTIDACVKSPVNSATQVKEFGKTTVTPVNVDSGTAVVKVSTVGGDLDGIKGSWTMADDDGWKLDGFGDDYLRTNLKVSLKKVIPYAPMQKCMDGQIGEMDVATIQRITFASTQGDVAKEIDSLNAIAEKACPSELSGFLAQTLAREVVAKRGLPASEVKCAQRKMGPIIDATGLAPNALKQNNKYGMATSAALGGIVDSAMKECANG